MYMCMYMCMCIYMHMYMCIHVCVGMCMCKCMRRHILGQTINNQIKIIQLIDSNGNGNSIIIPKNNLGLAVI